MAAGSQFAPAPAFIVANHAATLARRAPCSGRHRKVIESSLNSEPHSEAPGAEAPARHGRPAVHISTYFGK